MRGTDVVGTHGTAVVWGTDVGVTHGTAVVAVGTHGTAVVCGADIGVTHGTTAHGTAEVAISRGFVEAEVEPITHGTAVTHGLTVEGITRGTKGKGTA